MKKPTLLLAFVLFNLFLTAQNVGIGTNTPVARLHVADSSVVFTGPPNDSLTRNNPPPISGTGTRMMWYADRGAFRAGTVHGNIWDKDYIGDYSFGSGYDVSARGFGACATGTNTLALGNYSFASGYGTTAFGEYTTAMGIGTFALTKYSTAIGKYNSSVANALFEIGNGTSAHSGNALTVLENGNVGIGYVAPSNPLTFLASSGKKISLFPGPAGDAGFAIAPNELRVYGDNSSADITFGYDTYAGGFTENVRLKAGGMVGIGTSSPTLSTGTAGLVAQNSSYIQLRVQSSASAAGMEFKPSSGNTYEVQADNFNNWFVYNRSTNAYRILVNSAGNVGIGTNTPSQALQVVGNILASGTITPSDIRYKQNIQPLVSPLQKLRQLNGVSYQYRKEAFPEMGFSDQEQIGLIAQEVEQVFPQLVVTDDKGFKAVDYVKLVPVLIESTKAQQTEIEQLKGQVEKLQKLVEGLIKK